MKITRANSSHLPELVQVFSDYRVFYQQKSDHSSSLKFLQERLSHDESVIFICQTESDEIAGFTQLYPSFSSVSLKRQWILNDLFVAKGFRRQGVAKQLLEEACIWAKKDPVCKGLTLKTAVDNFSAQELYKKLGWVQEEDFISFNLGF